MRESSSVFRIRIRLFYWFRSSDLSKIPPNFRRSINSVPISGRAFTSAYFRWDPSGNREGSIGPVVPTINLRSDFRPTHASLGVPLRATSVFVPTSFVLAISIFVRRFSLSLFRVRSLFRALFLSLLKDVFCQINVQNCFNHVFKRKHLRVE